MFFCFWLINESLSIIKVSDGIMVARGDLGVEVPLQRVPLIQKTIVEKCLAAAKPCIIATQMMETMISSLTPTRAEVNDVANNVLDGADAVMLSGESSAGRYPVEAVAELSKIAKEIETRLDKAELHTFMDATHIFGKGIGSRKLKEIIN